MVLPAIGAGLGAIGSLAGGIGAANKAKSIAEANKQKIRGSALKQERLTANAYGSAEPLLVGGLERARASGKSLRDSLGGAQNTLATEARRRADTDVADLEANAAGSGLEFSSHLDSAKRAISGDVNRQLAGLELALQNSIAQVEGIASGMEGNAEGRLAQLRLERAANLVDIDRWKVNALVGQPQATPYQPNFAGLAAGLFGTADLTDGGLIGALSKGTKKSGVL